MANFVKQSLLKRLTIMFLCTTMVPVVALVLIVDFTTRKALIAEATETLAERRDSNKSKITGNLQQEIEYLNLIAQTGNTREAVTLFTEYHERLGLPASGDFPVDNPEYNAIHERILPFYSNLTTNWDYYDFYIISPHGHVMFTLKGESDLGQNIKTGKLKSSGLARVCEEVVEQQKPAIVDFSLYEPSGIACAFVGVPVFDDAQQLISVLVLQLSYNLMDRIIPSALAGTSTGEIEVVGGDYFMRANTRFRKDAILVQKVVTPATTAGLNNLTGVDIIRDYRGEKVLAAYSDVGLEEDDLLNAGFDWAIVAKKDLKEVLLPLSRIRVRIVAISIVLLLVVVLISYYLSLSISRPITALSRIARQVGEGDLSIPVDPTNRSDEIGLLTTAFSDMLANLKDQSGNIQEGVNVLASAVNEISATTSQLTASASETVTAIGETTTTIEEVRQTSQLASEKSKDIATASENTVQVALDGLRSVEDTIAVMDKIQKQMESIAGSIVVLSEQSQSIGEIMNSISDMAAQSNLLAVNASIEAAKAGEEGKGFSVVASEVKSLADQSKEATRRVREILTDIQKATSTAVMATEEGSRAVENGLKQSKDAGTAIQALTRVVEQAAQATSQIGVSVQEQFIGIDQINEAIRNISTASSQNLESTKQLETASSRLNELGTSLLAMTEKYKL
ncbi:MAG: methyl-accepting chemotaxis protein [Bacteroidota bacterium]